MFDPPRLFVDRIARQQLEASCRFYWQGKSSFPIDEAFIARVCQYCQLNPGSIWGSRDLSGLYTTFVLGLGVVSVHMKIWLRNSFAWYRIPFMYRCVCAINTRKVILFRFTASEVKHVLLLDPMRPCPASYVHMSSVRLVQVEGLFLFSSHLLLLSLLHWMIRILLKGSCKVSYLAWPLVTRSFERNSGLHCVILTRVEVT